MPINECALRLDNCDVNAVCTDTATSFQCACQSGYSGDGVNCTGKIIFSIVCLMGGQVQGNYSSIMLNSDAMTVQVHKHISPVLGHF